MSEVLACKTQWLDVSTPLMTICTGSKLGHRMFGFAMAMVSADRIAAYAINELKQVTGAITDDFEKNFSTRVMAEVTRLDISAALSERRQVKLSYRGLQLTMQTQGISDENSLRWGCFIREVGRSAPRLPFEFDIFGSLENAQDLSADTEEKVRVSRDALLKLLAEHPHSSFSEVCARKGDIVVQCDAGARAGLAIGEALVGAGGEALIMGLILKCMPDANLERTLEHSAQQLEFLREKEIYKAVSKRAQALLQATLEAVAGTSEGGLPGRPLVGDLVALPVLRHRQAEGQDRRRFHCVRLGRFEARARRTLEGAAHSVEQLGEVPCVFVAP